MILLFLTISLSVIIGQHDSYTHQTYVIPTEPASELASPCPDKNNVTQCLTLNELIDRIPGEYGVFQSQEEVIFLSGIHVVNGTERNHLFAHRNRDLFLRGESKQCDHRLLEKILLRI